MQQQSYHLPYPVEDLEHAEVELDVEFKECHYQGHGKLSAGGGDGYGTISATQYTQHGDLTRSRGFILDEEQASKLECVQPRDGDQMPRYRLVWKKK